MELAWEKGDLTVKKALFFVGETSDRSYTTVMTVLARLAEKGLLVRERQGRFFVYRPKTDRKTFLEERVRSVSACLKENFPDLA